MNQKYSLQDNKISSLTLIFIYLLLITFVLGHYIFSIRIIGVQWYAYRVLVIFLVILGVNSRLNSKIERNFIYFGIILFVYSMISLLWMPSFIVGFRYSANIAFGILLTYVLLGLIDTKRMSFNKIFEHFSRAWMLAVFISLIFLTKEVISGQTMEFSRARSVFVIEKSTHLYTSTFGGPSGYGPFLVICLPLFLHMVFSTKNFWERVTFFIGIILTSGAIILTGSRISAIAMIITFLLIGIMNIKRKALMVFALLICGFIAVLISYQINPKAYKKHFEQTSSALSDTSKMSSIRSRATEFANGISVLIDTNGLGCGPGNYVQYKKEHIDILVFPELSWMGTHSVILSIIAEYGLIIFVSFFFWFFFVFFSLFKINSQLKKMNRVSEGMAAKSLIVMQVVFFIWSFAFGGGLEFSLIWLYFATVTVLASSLWIYTETLKKHMQFYSQTVIAQNNHD